MNKSYFLEDTIADDDYLKRCVRVKPPGAKHHEELENSENKNKDSSRSLSHSHNSHNQESEEESKYSLKTLIYHKISFFIPFILNINLIKLATPKKIII